MKSPCTGMVDFDIGSQPFPGVAQNMGKENTGECT